MYDPFKHTASSHSNIQIANLLVAELFHVPTERKVGVLAGGEGDETWIHSARWRLVQAEDNALLYGRYRTREVERVKRR